MDVVFVRRIVGAKAVGTSLRLDMDYGSAVIGQVFPTTGPAA